MSFVKLPEQGINELTKKETKQLQGMAILMMIFLHLFCRKEFENLYDVVFKVNNLPLIYYLSLLCGSCVPIYSFCSGYGLYSNYHATDNNNFARKNVKRLVALLIRFELIVVITIITAYLVSLESIISLGAFGIIKNILLLEHSICGAWWYMQTYVLLVILTPALFKLVDRYSCVLIMLISGVFYCIGYLQRTRFLFIPQGNWFIDDMVYMIASLGLCQFAFIVGIYIRKYFIISRIRALINKKLAICINVILIPFLVVCHGIFESMVIDPIIGLMIVLLFSIIRVKKTVILEFFGEHSTNIWLVHMLLYQHFAKGIVFESRNPVVIFCVTMGVSVVVSYIINAIIRFINNMTNVIRTN